MKNKRNPVSFNKDRVSQQSENPLNKRILFAFLLLVTKLLRGNIERGLTLFTFTKSSDNTALHPYPPLHRMLQLHQLIRPHTFQSAPMRLGQYVSQHRYHLLRSLSVSAERISAVMQDYN